MSRVDADLREQLQALLDHKAISDKLAIWCRCADTRDMSRMTEVFADDLVWDFGAGTVDHGLTAVVERLVAHVGSAGNCGARQIHLANLRIDVDGDVAESEAYFFAASAGVATFAGQALLQWGNYLDHWERQDSGWRIVHRTYDNQFDLGPMEIVYPTMAADMWQPGDNRGYKETSASMESR
jgi:ketosteroid isomerase-like protein